MLQCCTGRCQMFYTLRVMLLIGLRKGCGHYSQCIKTRCPSSSFQFSLLCLRIFIDDLLPIYIWLVTIFGRVSVLLLTLWINYMCYVKQVGLVLDTGIEEELRVRHLQVAYATRASLGLPVIEYAVTDTPLQVETSCYEINMNEHSTIIWPLSEWKYTWKRNCANQFLYHSVW